MTNKDSSGRPARQPAVKRICRFYDDWQQAQARLEMALETLYGAQSDVTAKEVTFKAAARLRYGEMATYEYDPTRGQLYIVTKRVKR